MTSKQRSRSVRRSIRAARGRRSVAAERCTGMPAARARSANTAPLTDSNSASCPRARRPCRSNSAWLCPPRQTVSMSTSNTRTSIVSSLRPRATLELAPANQLAQFAVLHPHVAGGSPSDQKAVVTVEEAEAKQERAQECPRRGNVHRGAPVAAALRVEILSRQRGKNVELCVMLGKRPHSVVKQIACQAARRAISTQTFMQHAGESRAVAPVQAQVIL